jgi:hypothetical protein
LIVTGFLRAAFKNKTVIYFLLAVIVAAVSQFLNKTDSEGFLSSHISAFFLGTEEWSYFPFFPWYAYVLIGFAFSLFVQQRPFIKKMDIKNQFIYFVPLWIIVIATLPYAAGIAGNLQGAGGYYHHGILFFGWVLLFMLSYLVVLKLADIHNGGLLFLRFIKWMGREVTLLYIIQWLIIGNIATVLFRTQNLLQVAVWFGVITLVTILTGLLILKIRRAMKA